MTGCLAVPKVPLMSLNQSTLLAECVGGGEASYPASRYCNSHSIRWAYCYACSVVFLCTVCVWVSAVKEVIYSMHRMYNLLGGCLLATIVDPPKMAEPIQVPGLPDEESVRMAEKGKVFFRTRYRALGPELIPVYRQSARRWREVNHAIDLAVGCHYFLPGLRLPP